MAGPFSVPIDQPPASNRGNEGCLGPTCLVESLGGLLIDPSFKLLYVFAIYLAVVAWRPQGLFGRY